MTIDTQGWPADLSSGTVTGRLGWLDADDHDADRMPSISTTSTASVSIAPNVEIVHYLGADGPMLLGVRPVQAAIDAQGYICTRTADGKAGARGLVLADSDDEQLRPRGWSYTATITLGGVTKQIPFKVAAGGSVDLAALYPIEQQAGVVTTVDVTTADRAEVAALRAEAAARAAQSAQGGSGDSGSASSAASSATAADTSAKAAAASASTASTARADAVTAQGAAESAASSASASATAAASSATAARTASSDAAATLQATRAALAAGELTGEPGKDGAPGEPGRDGVDGAPGKDGTSPPPPAFTASATALAATAQPTAKISGEYPNLDLALGIPSGGGGGGDGGTVSTTAGPGTVAAAAGWTLSGLRNVRAGQVGQLSFRLVSPAGAQGAGEWVVATATAPLNALCPIPLQPVTWCADTTDQVTGTGLWEKATGRIRLHCNIGLAASVPLVVSCVYVSS